MLHAVSSDDMIDADVDDTTPDQTNEEAGDVPSQIAAGETCAGVGEALVGDAQEEGSTITRDYLENGDGNGLDVAEDTGGSGLEKGAPEDNAYAPRSEDCVNAADGAGDDLYRRVRELAVEAINAARDTKQLELLSPDEALAVPAMTHCRTMCEHDFLSHWDMAGRKPYQRYSDFAYGQHVSEEVFEFRVNEAAEDEVMNRIKECIEGRLGADALDQEGGKTNHMLDNKHTHIGIGVHVVDDRLRYAEVYADRYLELLDYPAELSVADAASGFHISVQMTSSDVGPYACLVFHDPVATPLTVGELQQQFSGPYSDFTTSQVSIIWPWQMDVLEDGVFGIPVSVSPIEAGTYYVQILVREDLGRIPYDTDPAGGLPLPGESFCGGALVLRASEEGEANMGMSDLDGAGGLLSDSGGGTLEEREARTMASTSALRRDLPPIVRVRVVQDAGGSMQQEASYENKAFMPRERAEDMAQLNLAMEFLRLGAWDDFSSREHTSEGTGTIVDPAVAMMKGQTAGEMEDPNEGGAASEAPVDPDKAATDGHDAPTDVRTTPEEATNAGGIDTQEAEIKQRIANSEGRGGNGDANDAQQPPVEGEGSESVDHKLMNGHDAEPEVPWVVTDIAIVRFREGEKRPVPVEPKKVEPPEDFELVPGDLANPPALDGDGSTKEAVGEQSSGEVAEGKTTAEPIERGEGHGGEGGTCGRDMVFLCVKVVNELYDSTIHVCYKKAGAALAVIQQVAEKTAEKTAKQIQRHLGIEGGDGDGKADPMDDEAYDVDTNMTSDQMLEWEEKRNREAAERALNREKVERDHRREEASDAVRRQIAEALKEKDELVKQNGEWQKKIASLMLSQQKTREEARTEHGGRGVEKEATPLHESEKNYAESLASIVSCRERLQEQQAEYDTVAIALQTRLDEKEYKSREIADSFREFKREIARTAEHSRTGKAIPKGVISQFEAAEAKKDREIEKVRLKNINLRMMLRKVEGSLRAKEQLAEGLHLIDFEQLKIENQTVNEKIEERNEELLKLRKKNTTTVQILTHTKEKLQFVAAENSVTSHQLSILEEDLNQERDHLTRAKKDRDTLRREVASLRQSQGFANSDLLILDFEQRKLHLKKLGQKLEEMKSKHHLLLLEQESIEERKQELGAVQL
ncbi:unnamed protein product [Ectocarpus sp. 12 AP-2014]